MKILVTGAKGFIGKNLVCALKNRQTGEVFETDIDTSDNDLLSYCQNCDFVFHLAGVNRPKNESEFTAGNVDYTDKLLGMLKQNPKKPAVLMSSSIQAELDNPYGKSKKAGEDKIFAFAEENGNKAYVFRLPNVFGKWCSPNYNSVVATFCFNIACGKPITVNGEDTPLTLVYVDDVVASFIAAINGEVNKNGNYCVVKTVYKTTLGLLADTVTAFKKTRENITVPDMNDAFVKKLYSTYLSYLPTDEFGYELKANVDERGSFTEFIRTDGQGQFSVNVAKPGITKGNHWHDTKNEKFLVVSGKAKIAFRKIGESAVYEYSVSGERPQVIDIPVGYTHNITNTGDTDLITLMWANEPFDKENPDTWYEKV